MNYEEFYVDFLALSEKLREQLSAQQRLFKRIVKSAEKGDLKSAARDIPAANAAAAACVGAMAELTRKIEGADMRSYLESGDFARQLVEICGEKGLDIKGDGNSYEIFPYRLKVDPQNAELLVNGRKAIGLRPRAVAEDMDKKRAKLMSAPFNPVLYASEMAAAYDLALLAGSKGMPCAPDADVYLTTLYKFLTPMRRFRREYNDQSYALDLARLYASDSHETSDGRCLQFGPSRNNARSIRILDPLGNEQFLTTIRFYPPQS